MDHLGFPAPAGKALAAAVQGQPADLLYTRHTGAQLTWTIHGQLNETHTIPADQIIGLIPVSPQFPDDHTLLYVELSASSDTDHIKDHAHFRSTLLTRPPVELLKDFAPSGRSCWQLRASMASGAPPTPSSEASFIDQTTPLHIILSVASGHRHAEAVFDNLLKPYLDLLGCHDWTLHKTTSSDTISELTRTVFLPAATAGVPKYILLLSGDGGVVDLINGLLPSSSTSSTTSPSASALSNLSPTFCKPTFTLLPLGTGNALAHSTGITADKTFGMSALLRGYPTRLPLFTVRFFPSAVPIVPPSDTPVSQSHHDEDQTNQSSTATVSKTHGAVIASWALHAALVADSDTPASRKHGAARFQHAARENLDPPHAYRGRVSIRKSRGGEDRGAQSRGDEGAEPQWEPLGNDRHSYVVATLCSRLEATFTVSPASQPLDGKLRIVHVGAGDGGDGEMTGEKLMGLMAGGYASGTHVQRNEVSYEEVDAVRFEMSEDDAENEVDDSKGGRARYRRVCVDGKIYALERGGVVEISGPGVPDAEGNVNDKGVLDMVYLPR